MSDARSRPTNPLYSEKGILSAVILVTAWRLVVLALADLPLSFDEAQYWYWAQSLEFGYFSKPPFIGWAIWLTTTLFGDGEWAVKLGSPLAHMVAALALGRLGTSLYGHRVGFWTAVVWITLPAVSFSSMIISVDPFLLMFWSLALLGLERGLRDNHFDWWLVFGLSLGFGLLSKYAMAFFFVSLVLYFIWEKEARQRLTALGLWFGLFLGVALFLPNLGWNAGNGFITFAHTQDNANLSLMDLFHPIKGLEFIGSQFGVFGPLLMGVFVWLVIRIKAVSLDGRAKFLLSFALPVLAVMVVQGFLSRANANWAAAAYPAASVLVVAWLAEHRKMWLTQVSVVLHLLAAVALYNMETVLPLVGVDLTAKTDLLKRVRGWPEIGRQVASVRKDYPDHRLLFDDREVMSSLVYYIEPHPMGAVMWNEDVIPTNHYELVTNMNAHVGEDFLLVTEEPDADHIAARFQQVDLVAVLRVPVYPDYGLEVRVFRCERFRGY